MQKRSARYARERFENPKVYNPYIFHRPFIFRWKGSVIPKILPQSILVTILSAIITYLYQETTIKLGMKQTFITVLGIVVSLLLAYRTNTAYDRYWEGLGTWSKMVVAIRNMTRCIWVNVNAEDSEKVIDDKTRAKHLTEKKTAINLLLGFAIATKHYLREEPVKFDDIKPYISKNGSNSPGVQISVGCREDNFSETSGSSTGTFGEKFMKNLKTLLPTFKSENKVNHNLPYELTLYISSYIHSQHVKKTTDDATISNLYSNLNTLTECLTSFERILRSPIPLAYAIHLTQVTWIYCLSLPFQLLEDLGWLTIPVTFLITMTLFGVEKIAGEIENPFGWDENDLGLDDFCGLINRELNHVTSEPIPPVNEWIYANGNIPFESVNINAIQARNLQEMFNSNTSESSVENNVENYKNHENHENQNDPNNDTVIKME